MGPRPKTNRLLVPEALPVAPVAADVSAVGKVHDAVGNLEVKDALGDVTEGPGPIRDSIRLEAAGIASQGQYDTNSAMLRAMRKGRGPAPAAGPVIRESGGAPLPEAERARMEGAFGRPLDHVRVHTDGGAAQAAVDLQAHAFALGSHVFFGPGEWVPGSDRTDRLLAHELTHVVQDDEGRIPVADEVSRPDDPLEREAYANEQVILDRLEANPSDDDVPDAISERLPTAPLVDGRAGAETARAESRLDDRAEQLGSGSFLRDAAQKAPPAPSDAASTFELCWLGIPIPIYDIDIADLLELPEPKSRVSKDIDYSPCEGVHFSAIHIEFDGDRLPKKAEIDVTLTVRDWVQQSSRLGVDRHGRISTKITDIQVNIPGLFKALSDLSFTFEGIEIDCDVDWPDFDFGSWGGGKSKSGGGWWKWLKGKFDFHWDGLKGPSGGGLLTGEIPTIGTISWDMKLDGLQPTGWVELAVFAPLTPLPGVRIDHATIRGSYNEAGLLLTGSIGVTVGEKFSGDAQCTYDLLNGTWSLHGNLPQLEPITVGGWELTEANIGLAVERGTFLAAIAKGLLDTPTLTGNFDGHIDIPNFEFSGGGNVTLKKVIEFGADGVIEDVNCGIEVVSNKLVAISGHLAATLPWNGSPAIRLETENGRLDLTEKLLTGDVTVTAMRELSIGSEGGTRLLVAEGATCSTRIEQNNVTKAEGGMDFKVVDANGDLGTGQISIGFSAAGSLDAKAKFTLLHDFGFPDFELGPAFLKEGGHFEVEVAQGEITLIKLVNVGFALMSGSKEDGLGMISGTVAGTWDGATNTIEHGTVSATVNNAFHIPLPYGSVVLEPGGTVGATIDAGALSALELHVGAHASIKSNKLTLGVKGRYDGTWDAEAGGMTGEATAQLTESLTVKLANGNTVMLHAEGSDFHIKFEPEGVTYVRFSAGVTYYRGGQPFVSGALEDATWDNGEVSFKSLLKLHDEFTRDLKGGRKLTIKKDTLVEVDVEKNSLKRIGGNVDFSVSDPEPLFSGQLKDVNIDVDKMEFTGGWSAKTDRKLTWPKQQGDPAAGGLRLEIAQGAGTSGRIDKNVLKEVKANIDFDAMLLSVKLGAGHADFDWDLANDEFSGKGWVKLDENFPLSRPGQRGQTQKPQDWELWVVKDSEIAVDVKKNILQEAEVHVQIVASDPSGVVLAGGRIDGQYKLGDPQGFHGDIEAEVKEPIAWKTGDRFVWTMLPPSRFDATINHSTIQNASGKIEMRGDEAGQEKVKVTGKGAYTPKDGFTGDGSVDVVNPIEFQGEQYKVEVTDSTSAKAKVVKDDLASVNGDAEAFVSKDSQRFLQGTGNVKYKGGKDAEVNADISLKVLPPGFDFDAKSGKYKVKLQEGAGGTVVVRQSKLVSIDGAIPIAVYDQIDPVPLVTASITGHYRHEAKSFTGAGEGKIGRRVELAKNVGKKGWSFFLETESKGKATVKSNNLEELDGTLVVTVQEGNTPILRLMGKGQYTGAGSKMALAEASVDILANIPVYDGKAYNVFLRKDGHADAKLGDGGIENFHGIISVGVVTKDEKPFADVELEGRYTEKEGFSGGGKATIHQSIEVALGKKYGLVIDKSLTEWIAEAKLKAGEVTAIGGTVNFRMDEKGNLAPDAGGAPAFLQGTITGFYDFKTFSGKGNATVGVSKRLVGDAEKGGEELWLMSGSKASVDIQKNTLQSVGGDIKLEMRDHDGPYLNVAFTDGNFDAVNGTGFSGKGKVEVSRGKRLFGRGAYEFWLDPRVKGEATANISKNQITEVTGKVPFLVKKDNEDFIWGAVQGAYKNGKVSGDGEVRLAKNQTWKLGKGGDTVTVMKGSGGGGHVEDSKLERLTGNFEAVYSPGGQDLMKLTGDAEYDVLKANLVRLDAELQMVRPVELLGQAGKPGTGLIIISGVKGRALLENNALVHANGKGKVSVPSLKNASGTFDVGWRNDGDGEKYHAEGDLNFPLIENPGKKRKANVDSLRVTLDEAGKLIGNVRMMYEMSELISGWVDVSVDEDLDPEVSGHFEKTGRLAKGADLFNFELPTIKGTDIELGYGFGIGYGAKAGMGLKLDDLTYTVPINVGPWRPLSSGLEVPKFDAALNLDWGLNFHAAAAAWLNLNWGMDLGEIGVGIKGIADLNAGLKVKPSGHLYSEDGGFHGELAVAIGLHPSLVLRAVPYIYAKLPLLDNPLEHEFSDLSSIDLGDALSFDWSTNIEFGDKKGVEQGPAPAPMATPAKASDPVPVTEEPNLGLKKGGGGESTQTPGGPDLGEASGGADQEQKAQSGGMGDKFSEIADTMKTIEIIGKGVAGLVYFITLIKDLISAWRFGIVGFIVVLVWKLVKGDLSWTKIKNAAIDVWEAMKKAAEIIAANLPDSLKRILEYMQGDRPSLMDALFGADDAMRECVRKGDADYAPLDMRVKMIEELFDGYNSEDDESCAVIVCETSERVHGDFAQLAYALDPSWLMNQVDGEDDTRIGRLMKAHNISYSTGW